MLTMRIDVDDPARPDVQALLEEHLRDMYSLSPPESVHALDVAKLKTPDVTFWTRIGALNGLFASGLFASGLFASVAATHESDCVKAAGGSRRRAGATPQFAAQLRA